MRQRQRGRRIAGNDNGVWGTEGDQAIRYRQDPRDQNIFPQFAIRESGIVRGINDLRIREQPCHLSANGEAAEAGIEAPERDRMAATVLADDGLPRYVWEPQLVEAADYVSVVLGSVVEAIRWRHEYDDAKGKALSRASPQIPVEANSATTSAA